ncbi:MAG: GFA family protein [Rhodospirillaceae bacterium]|jgi:hypothetical protein|nr:GFA family protein [Rhodospirillaceae bacterium]MBT4688249.1 GFA family protein [Rhodospirillaceae bacterium]MBT5079242.1 GFA family protein [Rhodospirillaceae bacterium]MBT5522474.1 GFA family protein [Rhodospirillaceae bacterium]MBT5877619.1 GFA family protein [Rhodospirillaceae bacterium]
MTKSDAKEPGGCACGAVRYVMAGAPITVHACHCTDCQRITGSAFATNAWIEKDRVELLSGELSSHTLPAGRATSTTHFCPQCGTSIWTEYSSPKFWFVRTTTLDNQQAFSPDIHIWTQSKQPWLQLPDGNPVFEQYYRREDVWPPDSLARFHAAIE